MFNRDFLQGIRVGSDLNPEKRSTGRGSPLHQVSAIAPAKINIYFQVGRPRMDGYHDVLSLYCAVSLYDRVKVTRRQDCEITVRMHGEEVNSDGLLRDVPLDLNNLAAQAALMLAEATPHPCGVDIEVYKNIPVAGGMAGGSADAAAVLVACDALWGSGHNGVDLERIATKLGADVPFSLRGLAAIGRGIGAELSPAETGKPFWWVVAPAAFGLSTTEVFAQFVHDRKDREPISEGLSLDPRLLEALLSSDVAVMARYLRNDLQESAIGLSSAQGRMETAPDGQPPIPELRRTLMYGTKAEAAASLISGSGPTVVLLAADGDGKGRGGRGESNARRLAEHIDALRGKEAPRCLVVRGPVAGARVISTVPARW